MKVVQVGFTVIVHEKQRLVNKFLQDVLHLLRFQIPKNRQHLGEERTTQLTVLNLVEE